eukprot:TRINITY_DN5986_c0_g1_i4.p1 TRINITY_DN5986_c0_g1~~TRINITY_DN5986_c0_g1_i4.p1  ORF type:complete len:137 (+),score=23.43 TRINITY_DN5986_c0_g1_i4:224-634(+)
MMAGNPDLSRRHVFLEEQEQDLEMQRRRLAQFHLANHVSKLSTTTNKLNWLSLKDSPKSDPQDPSDDLSDLSLTEQFSYLLEVLNSDPMTPEKPKVANGTADDQDSCCSSQVHNLPDSPFTTPRGSYSANNIPAAI